MNFKLFTEDNFGFDEIEARKKRYEEPEDDLPIKPFSTQWFMDVLSRKKIGGRIKSSSAFLDEVIWGEKKKPGTLRVRLTPNIEVCIEKMTDDLEGAHTWILKRVFMPKLKEYAGHEEIVASEVFEEVENLYYEKIDTASENYNDLLHLAKRMATRISTHAPLIYNYQDTIEKTKDYYVIYFSIRNAGVGKLVTRAQRSTLSPELTIDVNFNRNKGLIHIILSTVSQGGEGAGAEMDLPILDSYFAPSQNKDEIIDTVLAAIKYY